MNVALPRRMTLQDFLEWEDKQPLRYEFDGRHPHAMAGGTAAHAAIQRHLLFALTARLRGKPCQPYGSELKIQVAGRIRYPDAFVVCTPVAPDTEIVTDLEVIFEALSDSSENDDLVVKNAEYRATPSVKRYVILQQSEPAAIVFARKGTDWVTDMLTHPDTVLNLPEIGCSIPLRVGSIDLHPADPHAAQPA
jgi:Uma2 family endonuclease